MSEQTDDFLAHYGVVGMKWGKRSGGLKSRVLGSASDRNARDEARLTKASKRFAKPVGAKQTLKNVALYGNLGVGPGRMLVEKMVNKKLASVQADKARIDAGQIKAKDYMNTSVAGLLVSVRPKDK